MLLNLQLFPTSGSIKTEDDPNLLRDLGIVCNLEEGSEIYDPGGVQYYDTGQHYDTGWRTKRTKAELMQASAVKIQCVIRRYLASNLAEKLIQSAFCMTLAKNGLHTELLTRQQALLAKDSLLTELRTRQQDVLTFQ